jgi:hypothetical protein
LPVNKKINKIHQPIPQKKIMSSATSQVLGFLEEVENEMVEPRIQADGIFILEAALNYHYRKPITITKYSRALTEDLILDITAGEVSGSSLAEEYRRILDYSESHKETDEIIDFIDISDAVDQAGAERLRFTVVYVLPVPNSYYQSVGDWKAGAGSGKCNGTLLANDAATETGQIYNYRYANNWLNSSVYQNDNVYFTNIEVSGTGGFGIGVYNYPAITPDLFLPSGPGTAGALTNLGQFALLGSPSDNLNPGPGILTCIDEQDINIYATRLENNIYSVSPSNQGEPFRILMASDWAFAGGNSPVHHNIYAAYFGIPNN